MLYLFTFKPLKSTNMMKVFHALFIVLFLASCKTATYYISRHAERAGTMSSDPQLTPEGEKQALDLRDYLKARNIKAVYSTNYNRTRATARPTSEHFNIPVIVYNPQQANNMIDSLKTVNKNKTRIMS
jgi:2,3-bisphosphoglycerate-dependent phosphoglycerate mutase